MEIYLNQKRIKLNPKAAIGKGGEADIYDLKNGKVLKLFKQADHPDYQLLPQEQQAAKARLALHQQKLPQFPQNLPVRVIKPETLATDKQGAILGYTMPFLQNTIPLLKYSDRNFRKSLAISNVDGTLTNRFKNTSAQGLLQAKTGTLTGVMALSGYANPQNYREVIFSIIINNSNLPTRELQKYTDAIALLLTRLEPCT
jgi:hypothetical protein